MESIKIYCKYVKMNIRSQMEYKVSFLLMSLGHFAITFIEFLGMYALFARFEQIKGWNLYEVSVFYGIINISFAIAEAVGRGFDVFHNHVKKGTFDRILLRPRGLFLQIVSQDFQLMRIGRFLQGCLVLFYGLRHLGKPIDGIDLIVLLISLFCSILFFLGLMILQATLSFWSVESLEIINVFTYGGVQTAQYPIDIYAKWFQKILIYVVPVGSISYFSLRYVLRGENLLLACMAPLSGVAFFVLSLGLFRIGTRYYCSTGS